jgi:hypothetical protein
MAETSDAALVAVIEQWKNADLGMCFGLAAKDPPFIFSYARSSPLAAKVQEEMFRASREMMERVEESDKSRKHLVEMTKDFRKTVSEVCYSF